MIWFAACQLRKLIAICKADKTKAGHSAYWQIMIKDFDKCMCKLEASTSRPWLRVSAIWWNNGINCSANIHCQQLAFPYIYERHVWEAHFSSARKIERKYIIVRLKIRAKFLIMTHTKFVTYWWLACYCLLSWHITQLTWNQQKVSNSVAHRMFLNDGCCKHEDHGLSSKSSQSSWQCDWSKCQQCDCGQSCRRWPVVFLFESSILRVSLNCAIIKPDTIRYNLLMQDKAKVWATCTQSTWLACTCTCMYLYLWL